MLSTEKYLNIFQALPRACAIILPNSPDFIILDVNAAYLRILNTERGEVEKRGFFEILTRNSGRLKPEDRVRLQQSMDKVLQYGEPRESGIIQYERRRKADNRELRFWQLVHTPVLDEGQEVEYLIQQLDDVTDQLTAKEKRASDTAALSSRNQLHLQNENLQSRISRKIAQYESASRELNDFIYSVSHDLRAPLRRIDGFSQELVSEYLDQLDDTGAHYLKRVRQGAQDMGNLIDDLLKLSRISRRKLHVEHVDVSEVARVVFNELIEVENDRDYDLSIKEDLRAEADKGLLKAVLTNLLSNALKFTGREPKSRIEIGKKVKDGYHVFYVQDNGVGFDPEYSDKLFKAFDRLHSQKEFQGSGIGLATVKRIINLHGGIIWGESRPGEGATFYFNFQRITA